MMLFLGPVVQNIVGLTLSLSPQIVNYMSLQKQIHVHCYFLLIKCENPLQCKKVQVGKDQEKAQSEKDSHSKNRGGKKTN